MIRLYERIIRFTWSPPSSSTLLRHKGSRYRCQHKRSLTKMFPPIYIYLLRGKAERLFFINERSSATGFVLSFRLPRYRSRHFDTLDGSYWRKVGSEDVISWCWCGRDKEKRNVCCDEDCMGTYLRVEIDSCFVCTLVCIAVRSKVSMSIYLLSSIVIIKGASKLSQSIF